MFIHMHVRQSTHVNRHTHMHTHHTHTYAHSKDTDCDVNAGFRVEVAREIMFGLHLSMEDSVCSLEHTRNELEFVHHMIRVAVCFVS